MNTRREKVEAAMKMRASGMTHQQIADALGVHKGTVNNWFVDPDGMKQLKRRERYVKLCACGCGLPAPASAADGLHSPPRYRRPCYDRIKHERAHEKHKLAFRRYWNEHGRIPSASSTSTRANREQAGMPDWFPFLNDLQDFYGSWNAAVRACGFIPRPVGIKDGDWNAPKQFPEDEAA